MIGPAPTTEGAGSIWPRSWVLWFKKLELALTGWTRTYKQTFTYDFATIPMGSQASTVAIVEGVKAGSVVVISPAADTPGIIYTAVATSPGNVTIYAKNVSFGDINPGNMTFRIIVFQD